MYHPCYCEENVWHLANKRIQERGATTTGSGEAHCEAEVPRETSRRKHAPVDYVVFISNENQTVAFWSSSATEEDVIVWDYHVIFISVGGDGDGGPADTGTEAQNSVSVWDHDTRLCPRHVPCRDLDQYLRRTFRIGDGGGGNGSFEPLFRLVPAEFFREDFYSDRSHMRVHKKNPSTRGDGDVSGGSDVQWSSPPPPWNCILGGWEQRLRHDTGGQDACENVGADISPMEKKLSAEENRDENCTPSNRSNLMDYVRMKKSRSGCAGGGSTGIVCDLERRGKIFTLSELRDFFDC